MSAASARLLEHDLNLRIRGHADHHVGATIGLAPDHHRHAKQLFAVVKREIGRQFGAHLGGDGLRRLDAATGLAVGGKVVVVLVFVKGRQRIGRLQNGRRLGQAAGGEHAQRNPAELHPVLAHEGTQLLEQLMAKWAVRVEKNVERALPRPLGDERGLADIRQNALGLPGALRPGGGPSGHQRGGRQSPQQMTAMNELRRRHVGLPVVWMDQQRQ